jgi:hypothetical protein
VLVVRFAVSGVRRQLGFAVPESCPLRERCSCYRSHSPSSPAGMVTQRAFLSCSSLVPVEVGHLPIHRAPLAHPDRPAQVAPRRLPRAQAPSLTSNWLRRLRTTASGGLLSRHLLENQASRSPLYPTSRRLAHRKEDRAGFLVAECDAALGVWRMGCFSNNLVRAALANLTLLQSLV